LTQKLGKLTDTNTINHISELLESIPMSTPAIDAEIEARFTCRVWFKEAIRVLHAKGVICCPDVYALEKELMSFAKDQDQKTAEGKGFSFHVANSSA
jgi:hypothetical protein